MLRLLGAIREDVMATEQRSGKRLNTALAAAVAHPIRTRSLAILGERVASPAEIARELQLDVSKVGYHVSALAEAKLVEEVGSRPVRGAIEHFYKAVELPILTDEQEAELPLDERRSFAESILSLYVGNAAHGLDAGSLIGRADHHLTRLAFNTDEEGWGEATAAYMQLYERIFEIQEAAAARMRDGEEKPFRVVSFQSLFEIPMKPE
jgi:DNA-binding transcriptional ArsR family regulator